MQPTKIDNRQEDIFRGRLSNELNPKHEMMILSRLLGIVWNLNSLIFINRMVMLEANPQSQSA